MGVDLVLERKLGPLVLELNARPGRNIQIANRGGLLRRLEKVEEDGKHLGDASERIAVAKASFGVAEPTR